MIGYIQLNPQLIITLWNPTLADWTDIAASQAIGRPFFQIFPDLKRQGFETILQTALTNRQPYTLSHLLHANLLPLRSGLSFPQSMQIMPLLGREQVTGLELIITNVADRVSVEQDFVRQIQHLESLRQIDQMTLQARYPEALALICNHAIENLNMSLAAIFAPDETHDWHLLALESQPHIPANSEPLAANDLIRQVFNAPKSIQHLNPETVRAIHPYQPQAQAAAAYPLTMGQQKYGVFYLESQRAASFVNEAPQVLENLAHAAAFALHLQYTQAEQAQRLQELEIIHGMNERLRAAQTPEEILQTAFRYACEHLEIPAGALAHCLPGEERPVWIRTHSWTPDEAAGVLSRPELQAFCQEGKSLLEIPAQDGEMLAQALHNHDDIRYFWLFNLPETRKHLPRLITILGQGVASATRRAQLHAQTRQLYQQIQHHADELESAVVQRTAKLQQANARLEAILNAAAEGIIFADLDGRVQYANQTMLALTGREAPVQDGTLADYGFPRSVLTTILEKNSQNMPSSRECRLKKITGETYDARIASTPLTREGQHPYGLVLTIADISRQKQMERIKDELVATISHELRTPVTNILLYLENIPRDDPQLTDEFLDTLKNEGQRLQRLVEDILTMNRIQHNLAQPQLAPLDIAALAHTLVADRQKMAARKNQHIQLQVETPLPILNLNEKNLQQILTNLLDNALNYTPESSQVKLILRYDPPTLTLRVEDNGPGIAEEDLPFIFDRFYRGKNARENYKSGTGLGLAIVKTLVTQMQGKVQAENLPSGGSCFTVILPAQEAEKVI